MIRRLLILLAVLALCALYAFVVHPWLSDRADRRACVANGGTVEPDPNTVWLCNTPQDYP